MSRRVQTTTDMKIGTKDAPLENLASVSLSAVLYRKAIGKRMRRKVDIRLNSTLEGPTLRNNQRIFGKSPREM